MVKQETVKAIVNRILEDEEFTKALVSSSKEVRKDALAPYFEGDDEDLEWALDQLDGIVNSPYRDSLKEYVQQTANARFAG